jgi:hypothetical protein
MISIFLVSLISSLLDSKVMPCLEMERRLLLNLETLCNTHYLLNSVWRYNLAFLTTNVQQSRFYPKVHLGINVFYRFIQTSCDFVAYVRKKLWIVFLWVHYPCSSLLVVLAIHLVGYHWRTVIVVSHYLLFWLYLTFNLSVGKQKY